MNPREMEIICPHKDFHSQKWLKSENNSNIHQQLNGKTDCGMSIKWNTSQQQKGINYLLNDATTQVNLKGFML